MNVDENNYLEHYGILRRSGRYPWGSGGQIDDTPYSRSVSFFEMVDKLRAKGMNDVEIARGFQMTTTEFRNTNSIARSVKKQADIAMAQRLRDKGMSKTAIGDRMGLNESSVRALLSDGEKRDENQLISISNMLRDQVDSKSFIDVGSGVEAQIGITETKLKTALAILKDEGYRVHKIQVPQAAGGGMTTIRVLAKPDTAYQDVKKNIDNIRQINQQTDNYGETFYGILPPLSIDSKRVGIRYAEDGGSDADGVIYVRPGVDDVSMGGASYAQVRIAVDNTHYLKGMAVYKDDLPKGVDLVFNTNKSNTGNKMDALKPIKVEDGDSPFGATIKKQIGIRDKSDRLTKLTSAMNIINEEGDWDGWSRTIASQVLSKQSPKLAMTQLDMTYDRKRRELDKIMTLTNPAVRKNLLKSFSDAADSSAVHLKAAAIPGASWHVILPFNSLKPTEIYAPNFKDGERVALIRYPHGGTFEIPELVVNNKSPKVRAVIGSAKDAVGIHSQVAARLSGADFDGDTVLVIPNNSGIIKSTPALAGLKNFDPQRSYKNPEGVTFSGNKQQLMGDVSNLITDMTIRKAPPSDIVRAVRHSMVVIDAEKHNLNYKQSAIDNGIADLKRRYQNGSRSGASTLVSQARAKDYIDERRPRKASEGGPIDPATGKKVYVPTGRSYEVNGKTVTNKVQVSRLSRVDNAHDLSSGTPIETVYADHSNRLKSLANEARRAYINTESTPYSPSARRVYSREVDSLNAKFNLALRNRPLERQAQLITNAVVTAKRQANPDMDADELKKVKYAALVAARRKTGAEAYRIDITPEEWNAIQAGAISNHRLEQILLKANQEQVKQLATPKRPLLMSTAEKNRAVAMANSGYTQAAIAEQLGVSLTTLKTSLA